MGSMEISAGCADVYPSPASCQYLDITDVPLVPGTHTLRVTLNPDVDVAEWAYLNNTDELTIGLEDCGILNCSLIEALPRAALILFGAVLLLAVGWRGRRAYLRGAITQP